MPSATVRIASAAVRRTVAGALLSLLGSVAAADEAIIRVPVALAARVQAGEHGPLTIGIEADDRGPLVTVSLALRPLPLLPAYPIPVPEASGDPEALVVDESFRVPAAVAALAGTSPSALDVLVGVVGWVSHNVVLDQGDGGPQDAGSVLRSGRGRCSGRANLAVGLLRSLGVPARVVHGLVARRQGASWHRWGEAWLGPLGWLPFDPGAGAGVVGASYLPVRAVVPGVPPQGVRAERLEESGFAALPERLGLKVPLVRGVSLRCLLPQHGAETTAILVGRGGQRWVRRGTSEIGFSGLAPGGYWLTWQTGGVIVPRVPLDLSGAGDVTITLTAGRRKKT